MVHQALLRWFDVLPYMLSLYFSVNKSVSEKILFRDCDCIYACVSVCLKSILTIMSICAIMCHVHFLGLEPSSIYPVTVPAVFDG